MIKKAVLLTILSVYLIQAYAQERKFPIIPNYGGIFDIEKSEDIPDRNMNYNIVVEIATGSENPHELNFSLNNVARLINLHAQAGITKDKIKVIVAIHGEAAYSTLNNEGYEKKYSTNNPNLNLLTELKNAGVELYICGQSLIARKIDQKNIAPELKVALSMLTTVTTYQLKGYAYLKF